jgi:type I restriction enzyme S subunit
MSSESPKPLILPLFANTVKSEWLWERLDNIAVVYDCPHSTPLLVDDHTAPYVVRSQDVRTGTILLENAARVSIPTYQDRIKRIEPHFGDLVYSREGTYFGIAAEVPRGIKICLGQRMVLIRPDTSKLNYAFLKYWLNSPLIFGHIHGFRDGTVAERLNLPVIRGLAVALPTLAEQREIAEVLSTLDDRIALLRETNTTLETIAQALFKSWFVDFDPVRAKQEGLDLESMDADTAALFPDSFEESELGLVPKGWRVEPLPEMFDFKEGPGIRNWQYTNSDEGTRFINIRCIQDGDLSIATASRITDEEANGKYAHFHLKAWDVVVSTSGTLGRSAIVRQEHLPLMLNTSVIRFQPIKGKTDFCFVYQYLNSSEFLITLESMASGSVQKNFGPVHLKQMKLLRPPFNLISHYESISRPMFEKIVANRARIANITTLRDTLLPRLISGKLCVQDAEALAEVITS